VDDTEDDSEARQSASAGMAATYHDGRSRRGSPGTDARRSGARERIGTLERLEFAVQGPGYTGAQERIRNRSSAWISLRRPGSTESFFEIFSTAEMTVVWCLPPNVRPRSG